jgi:hypothetical protein
MTTLTDVGKYMSLILLSVIFFMLLLLCLFLVAVLCPAEVIYVFCSQGRKDTQSSSSYIICVCMESLLFCTKVYADIMMRVLVH